MSRRSLLRRGGALALTAGAGAALAGCENTTTPVAVGRAASGGKGHPRRSDRRRPGRRVRHPARPPRLPGDAAAHRRRGQERRRSPSAAASCRSTTTPTTSTRRSSRRSASRRASASASPRSTRSTRRSRSSAPAGCEFDIIFIYARPALAARGPPAHPAAELRADPEPARRTSGRSCTARSTTSARATACPYTVYTTGIGWRNDLVEFDPAKLDQPWDAFWAGREVRAARSAILDDSREGLGHGAHAPRRDRPQHRGPGRCSRRPAKDLQELNSRVRREGRRSPSTRSLPAGRMWLHQSLVGRHDRRASSPTCPRARSPTCSRYWYQTAGRADLQRLHLRRARRPTKPVIAHRFLNYMLDNKVAYDELRRLRRLPAADHRDRRPAAVRRRDPAARRCATAVVTREAYANGNAYLTLSAKGQQLWDRTWASFRNG